MILKNIRAKQMNMIVFVKIMQNIVSQCIMNVVASIILKIVDQMNTYVSVILTLFNAEQKHMIVVALNQYSTMIIVSQSITIVHAIFKLKTEINFVEK